MHPSGATNGMRVIVWDIRLPYALMALPVGMALGLAGAEMQTILNNSSPARLRLAFRRRRPLAQRWRRLFWASVFPAFPKAGLYRQTLFFALLSALLLDSLTRWTRVPTSGVVLFGIALVFTFNALVSIMQFVADEDTLQGPCSGRWAAGSRIMGETGGAGGGDGDCFTTVAASCPAAYRATPRRRAGDEFWH